MTGEAVIPNGRHRADYLAGFSGRRQKNSPEARNVWLSCHYGQVLAASR